MKRVLYFAYGSNMLTSRLIDRVGKVIVVGSYKLYGYKLSFNASNNYISYANIIPATKNDYVEGILYELKQSQFRILDNYEAIYDRHYFISNTNEIVCTYICKSENTLYKTPCELDYLQIIMLGCKNYNLEYTHSILLEESKTAIVKKKVKQHSKKLTCSRSSFGKGWAW